MIIQYNEPNVPEDPLIEDPCISYRTKASVMNGLIFIAGLKCSQHPPVSEVTVDGLYLGYNAKEGWSRMRLDSSTQVAHRAVTDSCNRVIIPK